jgi:hypothetical protein
MLTRRKLSRAYALASQIRAAGIRENGVYIGTPRDRALRIIAKQMKQLKVDAETLYFAFKHINII